MMTTLATVVLGLLCLWLCGGSEVPMAPAALGAHNEARFQETRTEHVADMYELVWDEGLAREARAWARGCRYEHSSNPGNREGQNLYYQYPLTQSDTYYVRRAVDSWMEEKGLDTTGNFDCCYHRTDCCHYTQVVASKTRSVGCAVAHCPTLTRSGYTVAHNAAFVVCQYSPWGNLHVNGHHEAYTKGIPCSQCDHGDSCSHGLCVQRG